MSKYFTYCLTIPVIASLTLFDSFYNKVFPQNSKPPVVQEDNKYRKILDEKLSDPETSNDIIRFIFNNPDWKTRDLMYDFFGGSNKLEIGKELSNMKLEELIPQDYIVPDNIKGKNFSFLTFNGTTDEFKDMGQVVRDIYSNKQKTIIIYSLINTEKRDGILTEDECKEFLDKISKYDITDENLEVDILPRYKQEYFFNVPGRIECAIYTLFYNSDSKDRELIANGFKEKKHSSKINDRLDEIIGGLLPAEFEKQERYDSEEKVLDIIKNGNQEDMGDLANYMLTVHIEKMNRLIILGYFIDTNMDGRQTDIEREEFLEKLKKCE